MRTRITVAAPVLAVLAAGCERGGPAGFQGYAEGEFVLVASPFFVPETEVGAIRTGQPVTSAATDAASRSRRR